MDLALSDMKALIISIMVILTGFFLSSFIPSLYAQDDVNSTSTVVDVSTNNPIEF